MSRHAAIIEVSLQALTEFLHHGLEPGWLDLLPDDAEVVAAAASPAGVLLTVASPSLAEVPEGAMPRSLGVVPSYTLARRCGWPDPPGGEKHTEAPLVTAERDSKRGLRHTKKGHGAQGPEPR